MKKRNKIATNPIMKKGGQHKHKNDCKKSQNKTKKNILEEINSFLEDGL